MEHQMLLKSVLHVHTVLCNDMSMGDATGYVAPDCVLIHEDHPPVRGPRAFIDVWQNNLAAMPDYHKDIRDMVVEMEPGAAGVGSVWVYSRIQGIAKDTVADMIDVMRFTADGSFLDSKDVQRRSTGA